MNAVTSSYRSQSISVRYNRTATRWRHALKVRTIYAFGADLILMTDRIGGSTGPLKDITYHDLASDVAATIDSLVGHPATIIGHDFGNRIARTLASDYPRLVKQLILLSAGGMVPRSPEMERPRPRSYRKPRIRTVE